MVFKRIGTSGSAADNKDGPARAVALGYDPERDDAPRVLATGQGVVAEQIMAIAKENGVPIHADPTLALALAKVELDTTIPPELYYVVAEVLAYIYRIQQKNVLQMSGD